MSESKTLSSELSFAQNSAPGCEAVIHTMQEDLSSPQPSVPSPKEKLPSQPSSKENLSPASATSQGPWSTSPEKPKPTQAGSPFLNAAVKSMPAPLSGNQPAPSSPAEKNPLISDKKPTPLEKPSSPEESSGLKKTILAMISLLALIAFGGAAYFFLSGKKETPLEINPPVQFPESPAASEPPVTITPLAEKYSSDKPNVLQLDMASASAENISSLLSSAAQDIAALPSAKPYEFIVADSANNPVAFPIFAIAANLSFAPDFLSLLEEPFSLFLYNESGISKFALVLSLKDPVGMEKTLSVSEKNLPGALLSFYPEQIELPAEISFSQSSYGPTKVRYFNFPSVAGYSLDYALIDSKLILATSKDSLRAVLDKLLEPKITPEAQLNPSVSP